MVTDDEKSSCFCCTVSVPTTSLPNVSSTMVARPAPYSDASSITNTLVLPRVSEMYLAAAGPWVASLPSIRKNVSQPFEARSGLVAEGVIVGSPAS